MGLREFKPTSPGIRHRIILDSEEITSERTQKSLVVSLKRNAGRNNQGRITCQSRGGGARRFYRLIDFKRDKKDVPARVEAIEYDPYRSANIALLVYRDGERRYILAPHDLHPGDTVVASDSADIRTGNCLPMKSIPAGTIIHNVELKEGKGGQMGRGAGSAIQLMAKEGDEVILRLPSGEQRKVSERCHATIGQVGNLNWANIVLGSAGASRRRGRRPDVRGAARNPNDHPHGGGEGKSPIGRKSPVSREGIPALGFKTRNRKKPLTHMILSRRK